MDKEIGAAGRSREGFGLPEKRAAGPRRRASRQCIGFL